MTRGRIAYVVLACALSLSGCALLGGGSSEPLDTYALTAATPEPGQRSRRQILIAEPTAIQALDGQGIVIKPEANVIQTLKGAQWADRLPRIVQARLAETFQRSGRYGGVGKPGEGLAIDYQVVVDVRSFEIRVDGADRAEVALYVQLLNDRNGVVRSSRLFNATVPVSGSDNDAFVAALDRAFCIVATEIVNWTATQI